jgi:hypothetical protein
MGYRNPTDRLVYDRRWRRAHRDLIRKSNARYRANHRLKVNGWQRDFTQRKHDHDQTWRLRVALQNSWDRHCRRAGIKAEPFLSLLGVKWPVFCAYLESQFTPEMCWANYGYVFEVDHHFPLAIFNLRFRRHRQLVCCFANLVPMTIAENRRKQKRFNAEELETYKRWYRKEFRPSWYWRQRTLFDVHLLIDPRRLNEIPGRRQGRLFLEEPCIPPERIPF